MAKGLLWIYVIVNMAMQILSYLNDVKPDSASIVSIWITIAVIAICDAIEKSKKVTVNCGGRRGNEKTISI
ncbi:hypothetical protein [Lysinibacillus sphaericus]|uniref:hypothetical protein n=1 Tax=Lysinibacillus sphaericus TaxID=1421 RepID=UPI003D068704